MAARLSHRCPSHPRWRWTSSRWLAVVAVAAAQSLLAAQVEAQTVPPAPQLTRAEQEAFLSKARIVRRRSAPGGITGSHRVTLTDGVLTHDAHVQTIDQEKREFRGTRGVELNFRDSWRYNVAAYRLDTLLELGMVPVSVKRNFRGKTAAFTWWVDDVAMTEATRLTKKIPVPNPAAWNQRMYVVRVFDQLIYNTDRNLGNLIITGDWDIWMIDHTRAFRRHETLRTPQSLTGCDRALLTRLQALDRPTLDRELGEWLEPVEIKALLARRDEIVEHFRNKSPDALFDLPPRGAAGLATGAGPR